MKAPKGIFWVNFMYFRKIWSPCHQVWCGRCYIADLNEIFRIETPSNDQGIIFKRIHDMDKCLIGRDGDFYYSLFSVTYAGSEICKIEILLRAVGWMIYDWCTSDE